MPLFAFECVDCHDHAELLVSGSATALCPSCGSSSLEKQPSAFAPVSGGAMSEPVGCGASSCCMAQGGCAQN